MRLLALPPQVTDHGGSLTRAKAAFPDAPQPWVDLSTGINPHAYPAPDLPAAILSRLPEAERMEELVSMAARAYGAPSPRNVVAAPGTQLLLPLIMGMIAPGRAGVLSPTYAEHARVARLCGHSVIETDDVDALSGVDLAVVVNPNNPDGRVVSRAALLGLADELAGRDGLLIVDEAFMEVGPQAESVAGDVERQGLVVLRSFGKFFGLAGLRLGVALAGVELASAVAARLGPWAVSGPAIEYGITGLGDLPWRDSMRERLAADAKRLDGMLDAAGLTVEGGTSLYRFARTRHAAALFDHLAGAGILVRRFDAIGDALRFGLPRDEQEFGRLRDALRSWTLRPEG